MLGLEFRLGLNAANKPEAVYQWENTENPKGAIDKLPVQWNAADRTADQSQRDDSDASEDASANGGSSGARIDERANEEHGDHNVTERQPVSAVSHPGVNGVGMLKTVANREDPECDSAIALGAFNVPDTKCTCKDLEFFQ